MELYYYIEYSGETLEIHYIKEDLGYPRPIVWAQEGRYGWISKEQVKNLLSRYKDLGKQQKGYAKDKPIDFAFHWDDTTPLDPATVRLMREVSDRNKKCFACKQILPIGDFRKNRSAKDRLNICCRKCEDLQDEEYLGSS